MMAARCTAAPSLSHSELLVMIETHLRHTNASPSSFGRRVMGDPRFVFDVRRGRMPSAATIARLLTVFAQPGDDQ